jgi:hypothetical protein
VVEACLESKVPTSVEMKSIAVREEVPEEESRVEVVRSLEEWCGDQHLAIGHCQQLKKWTQGNGGSWKKLAAAYRQMTHRTVPA